MKRSNSRIGIIVLFASLLMMFNAYPVISHAALVEFDILDETVCQGDVVEVLYQVYPDVEIGDHDKLQLRRGEIVVSEVDLDGMREDTVSLDTSSDNAPGEFAVVYVQGETGEVLGTAEETVVVLSEVICTLKEVAKEFKGQATSVNRQDYIAEFISMLQVTPAPDISHQHQLAWSLQTIAFDVIDATQLEYLIKLEERIASLSHEDLTPASIGLARFNSGKCMAFSNVLIKLFRVVQQYTPPQSIEPDQIMIEAIPSIVGSINDIIQIDAIRVKDMICTIGPYLSNQQPETQSDGYYTEDELPNINGHWSKRWEAFKTDADGVIKVVEAIQTEVGNITETYLQQRQEYEKLSWELVKVIKLMRLFYTYPYYF